MDAYLPFLLQKTISNGTFQLTSLAKKGIFYLVIIGLAAGFFAYNYLLFASEWSETVLQITVAIFILAVLVIFGVVFGSMAFSYPPSKSFE